MLVDDSIPVARDCPECGRERCVDYHGDFWKCTGCSILFDCDEIHYLDDYDDDYADWCARTLPIEDSFPDSKMYEEKDEIPF